MIVKELVDRMRNAKNERECAMRRRSAGMLALGVSIGCTVGAVAGVLFAPRAGKETREDVSRLSGEAWEKIKDNVSASSHRLADAIEDKGARVYTAAEKCVGAAKESLQESSAQAAETDSKK